MFQAIRKSKPHAAPGPDLIGPGIWRHQKAIGWAANQLQALALKQSLTLKAPIQNRGGSLCAFWNTKRQARCLIAQATGPSSAPIPMEQKNVAKCERAQVLDDVEPFLSHDGLFQCGGLRLRGTDVANLLVRSVFAKQAERNVSGGGIYVDIVSVSCANTSCNVRRLTMPSLILLCWP